MVQDCFHHPLDQFDYHHDDDVDAIYAILDQFLILHKLYQQFLLLFLVQRKMLKEKILIKIQ
jgi:hypothetical protein